MCDQNKTCESVECGDYYCSWWKNDKCNDDHELSDQGYGLINTCVKISDDEDDNGRIIHLKKNTVIKTITQCYEIYYV